MSAKIAVICAYNPGNSGMYSVDLAAVNFFKSIDCNFDLFVTQSPVRGIGTLKKFIPTKFLQLNKLKIGSMTFQLIKDLKQLDDYSHFVYWGDFVNNPIYGKNDFSVRDKFFGISDTEKEAFKRWNSMFIPEKSTGKKIASIGNNFQHPFTNEEPDIINALKALEQSFDLILPRDNHSVVNLRQLLPSATPEKLELGLDCAFLLDKANDTKKVHQFSCLFKRTKLYHVGSLIEQIEEKTNAKPVELDSWLELKRSSADQTFNNNIETITQSAFVLTDTYHVCVNAMRLGVPVFAIGRKSNDQVGTLGDFKKQTLFEMFNASEFYFEINDGEDEQAFYQKVVEQIETFLSSSNNSYANVQGEIEKQQHAFKEKLVKFINS